MKKNFSRVTYTKGRLKLGYTYKISAQRMGGERTLGTIPAEKALWWLKNENDDFTDYFMHEEKEKYSAVYCGHREGNKAKRGDLLHHYYYSAVSEFFLFSSELLCICQHFIVGIVCVMY